MQRGYSPAYRPIEAMGAEMCPGSSSRAGPDLPGKADRKQAGAEWAAHLMHCLRAGSSDARCRRTLGTASDVSSRQVSRKYILKNLHKTGWADLLAAAASLTHGDTLPSMLQLWMHSQLPQHQEVHTSSAAGLSDSSACSEDGCFVGLTVTHSMQGLHVAMIGLSGRRSCHLTQSGFDKAWCRARQAFQAHLVLKRLTTWWQASMKVILRQWDLALAKSRMSLQ